MTQQSLGNALYRPLQTCETAGKRRSKCYRTKINSLTMNKHPMGCEAQVLENVYSLPRLLVGDFDL